MRPLLLTLFLTTGLMVLLSSTSFATGAIGIIKSVSGNVYLTNSESHIKAVPNMRLNEGDSIQTESESHAGIILEDDTVVSLGSNSEMFIEKFIFDPAGEKLAFIGKLLHGTFSIISGQISKLAPEKVKLETPDATLGVRGTKFLVKID